MSKVILLYASMSHDSRAKHHTDSCSNLFEMKGIPFIMVDGATPENKDIRNKLFDASGKRGQYPQVFIEEAEGSYKYVGDWDDVSSMNELNSHSGLLDKTFECIPRVSPGTALTGIHTSGIIIDKSAAQTPLATPQASPLETIPPIPATASSVPVPAPAPAPAAAPIPSPPSAETAAPKKIHWDQMEEDGETYWWSEELQETSWVDPRDARVAAGETEALWVPQTDDKGRQFYYNYRTGTTRWSL